MKCPFNVCSRHLFYFNVPLYSQGNYATQDNSGMCHLMPSHSGICQSGERRMSGHLYAVAVQV